MKKKCKCNFNETTSVKINKEKKDLAKAKGLKLQDLLDNALNEELKLNEIPRNQKKINDLTQEIESLKKTRDDAIADCEKKIDILMRNLNSSKEREREDYNKKIRCLEAEVEYLTSELENENKN